MYGVRFMIYEIHIKLIKHRNIGIAIQNSDIFRKGPYNTCLRFVSINVSSQYWKIISISNQIDLSKHFVQICIDVTTHSLVSVDLFIS